MQSAVISKQRINNRSIFSAKPVTSTRIARPIIVSQSKKSDAEQPISSRREIMMNSVNVAVLAAMFTWGATPRPSGIGVQDYGGGVKTLALCPASPNCVSTAEEMNDPDHFVPGWTYNPEDGRGLTKPATQAQAMQELVDVVESTTPDGFTPTIVKRTDDYLYVEYQSPTFGFIDDFEVYFPDKPGSVVEYRSASRIGESDGNINRKRIKAIRVELQKKGWRSLGF